MERNKAATSVTSDEMDTALHGAARQNIKWDACISGNFHPQPPLKSGNLVLTTELKT